MICLFVKKAENGMIIVSDGKHTARYMLGKRAAIKEFAETFDIRKRDIVVRTLVA